MKHTYENYPKSCSVRPITLAKAGFFHTGNAADNDDDDDYYQQHDHEYSRPLVCFLLWVENCNLQI